MPDVTHSAEAIKKLNHLIKDIKFAMLTTAQPDGQLRSRPMATQETDQDGNLWFFTGASSPKVSEIREHQEVNISYASPEEQRYVSVSGAAEVVRDMQKMRDLWNPVYRAYFPKGLDDPDLTLLKVRISEAEYWDSPSSRMVQIAGFVRAVVTGQRSPIGEHGKLDVA
ncbi:MAG TPA: pyridoxamine 5'-phosphate oxidase family protein [Terriglobales bacterium]|nr:pyridoxamine 5'-phosphate oxidase family protein [Terriglobales bacterium]